MIKVHIVNLGSLFPLHKNIFPKISTNCIIIEYKSLLGLVDTGFGTQDCKLPWKRLGPFFKILNPCLNLKETAVEQLKKLHISPEKINTILVTHLDLDHAGGISDFPNAKLHCNELEYQIATQTSFLNPRIRKQQFINHKNCKNYNFRNTQWFNFPQSVDIEGFDGLVKYIPLPGHSLGHIGVAIKLKDFWLFHGGDSYFHSSEIKDSNNTKIGKFYHHFEKWIASDKSQLRNTQNQLRLLHKNPNVKIMNTHDPIYLKLKVS